MHLIDATLQMIAAQNNMNGFEIFKYLQKKLGQILTNQIIVSGTQEEQWVDDRFTKQSGQRCV